MNFKSVVLILLANQISLLSSELLRAPLQPHFDYAFTKFRPPPPPPEPTFIQRITNWIFPWGWSSEEEQLSIPAMPKIDSLIPPSGPPPSLPIQQQPQTRIMNSYPFPTRDTEPTTARTTRAVVTKCSPCNKVPWIPMMPSYQLPVLKGNQQHSNQQVFVAKHHFGNENPYVQIPASNQGYQYTAPSTFPPVIKPQKVHDVYGVPNYSATKVPPLKVQENVEQLYGVPHHIYEAPSTSKPPPIKLQQLPSAHQTYGVPSSYGPPSTTSNPIKIQQTYGLPHSTYGPPSTSTAKPPSNFYGYPTVTNTPQVYTTYQYTTPFPAFPPSTTPKINFNTIDTSVITFTTNRPQNNRPIRFTSPQGAVTNPEYLPPPNILPLEGENSAFKPIPIPNLSPTPIPPLFDAQQFHDNPYSNQKTGFIKLVPLEPVAQLSNNVDVQVNPNSNGIEVVNSRLVAEFALTPEGTRELNQSNRQNGPVKINIDIGNNLDNFNATLSAPILVESGESATDASFAASEKEYHHNVQQELSGNDHHVTYDEQLKQDETNNNRVLFNNEEETTTETNYNVKFEPSIQTAADLEDEARKNRTNYKNRDRETPLEMLDSPIQHRTPTVKTTTTESPSPPPFKPMQDFSKTLATLWTAATRSISLTTQSTILSTTLKPTVNPFIAKLSGITLQKVTTTTEAPTSTKKSKQIVLPYTTINRPSPFKPQDEQDFATYKPFIRGHYVTHPPRGFTTTKIPTTIFDFTTTDKNDLLYNAHGYHNDEEYQVAQESQIVESKVKIEPPSSNGRLTKIIANNIRDLLRKEKTSPKPVKIDLIKLQRNIDGWTEQSFKGKASTMAIFGHTKAIPTSFLTTMMTTTTIPTTTLSSMTTFDPDLMEETKRQYENILYKNEDEIYVKRHDRFLNRDNELVLLNNNLTQNAIKQGVKVYAPKSTLSPKELWHRLHLTVSPLTNERVYVVTPQPPSKDEINDDTTVAYKPRFAIRPTIAGNLFKMSLLLNIFTYLKKI